MMSRECGNYRSRRWAEPRDLDQACSDLSHGVQRSSRWTKPANKSRDYALCISLYTVRG